MSGDSQALERWRVAWTPKVTMGFLVGLSLYLVGLIFLLANGGTPRSAGDLMMTWSRWMVVGAGAVGFGTTSVAILTGGNRTAVRWSIACCVVSMVAVAGRTLLGAEIQEIAPLGGTDIAKGGPAYLTAAAAVVAGVAGIWFRRQAWSWAPFVWADGVPRSVSQLLDARADEPGPVSADRARIRKLAESARVQESGGWREKGHKGKDYVLFEARVAVARATTNQNVAFGFAAVFAAAYVAMALGR